MRRSPGRFAELVAGSAWQASDGTANAGEGCSRLPRRSIVCLQGDFPGARLHGAGLHVDVPGEPYAHRLFDPDVTL